MSKNAVVSLTLQLKGNVEQKIKQIADTQLRAVQRFNAESQKLRPIQDSQILSARKLLSEMQKQGTALAQQSREIKAVDAARKLGIRTEQQIKNEINQTRASYQQLSLLQRQGVVSVRDTERAYAAMRNRVAQLNAELGITTQRQTQATNQARQQSSNSSPGYGVGNKLQTAAAVAGGVAAAGMIGSNYLKDPREYIKQISYATDTVLAGETLSIEQYQQKVKQLEKYVRKASVTGGSTPQDMVAALNTLVASNVYAFEELEDALLQISKTAFAAGALPDDIARMAVAQRNYGGLSQSRANDQAFKAGQLGSLELRDMARYMPDLLTQGRGAGYIGESGYRDLLAMMQLAKKTAGTSEGAAVNLSDLLSSFSQYHLGLSFAKHIKVDPGDPIAAYGISKKRTGFDWPTYAANMRAKGVGEVDAAAMLMQRQISKNPLYTKYYNEAQSALKRGDDATYTQNVQAATQIVAQSEIGKIFHNKQALAAFMGITMNMGPDSFKEQLDKGILDSTGVIDTSAARHAASEFGKDGSLDTARFNARVDNYQSASGPLGDIKQWMADLASEHNGVAAAASAAAVGLTAVAAAAGIAAIAQGGGRAGGIGQRAASGMRAAGPTGLVAGAGLAGYGTGSLIYDKAIAGTNTGDKIGEVVTKIWAALGSDNAKAALEAQATYDAMLAEQARNNQISAELSTKIGTLIDVTRQNKPLPFPSLGNGNLAQAFGRASADSSRHGAAQPFMLKHTGR